MNPHGMGRQRIGPGLVLPLDLQAAQTDQAQVGRAQVQGRCRWGLERPLTCQAGSRLQLFDTTRAQGPQPGRFPEAHSLLGRSGLAPAPRAGHQGEAQALGSVVGAGIGPGGRPEQGHPQQLRRDRRPLGPIQQHGHTRPGRLGRQPADHRHLPTAALPGRGSRRRPLDHAAAGVGG